MEMQGDSKACSQLWEKELDPSFWQTISCTWRNEVGSCPAILRKITHQPRAHKAPYEDMYVHRSRMRNIWELEAATGD